MRNNKADIYSPKRMIIKEVVNLMENTDDISLLRIIYLILLKG